MSTSSNGLQWFLVQGNVFANVIHGARGATSTPYTTEEEATAAARSALRRNSAEECRIVQAQGGDRSDWLERARETPSFNG